jgi:nitrogen regulatory protein P-II 1
MPEAGRQLLVAIVKGHGRVERIMEGFLEIGVGGATVIDAKGMGQIISSEMPIFSGFRSLFPSSGEESYMVMSVIDDDAIDDAVAMLRDVCDGFKEKGTGVVFTLPVTNFFGPV